MLRDFHGFLDRQERPILLLLLIVCAFTRLFMLGDKPLMHDESLFAYYAEMNFHRSLSYNYMPILHGPLLLILQGFVFWLLGANDATMRLVSALSGIGGFLLLAQLRPWVGGKGRLVMLALYTFSAPLMYYQRFLRGDPLMIFLNIWAFVALLNLWRTRSPLWLFQSALALTLMFCTLESVLFFYFALATFGILLFLEDLIKFPLFARSAEKLTIKPLHVVGLIFYSLLLFVLLFTFKTQVMEGISYDADVQAALGANTPLATMNTPKELMAGSITAFLKVFVLLGFSCGFVSMVYYVWVRRMGKTQLLPRVVDYFLQNNLLITVLLGFCFFLYWAQFTTFFVFPKNPFWIYRDTLAYWMGQNTLHRIEGPFHYHLAHLMVYELPLVVGFVLVLLHSMWSKIGRRALLIPTGLFLIFLLILNAVCFLIPGVFSLALVIPFIGGVGFLVYSLFRGHSNLIARVWIFGLCLYFVLFLLSPGFHQLYSVEVKVSDPRVHNWGDYLDETISTQNSWHLLMIILPTLLVLHHVWLCLLERRRFEAFAFWWALCFYGATSYAREKVPWVGMHTIVPLLLIAGIYSNRILSRNRPVPLQVVGVVAIAVSLFVGIKNSAQLNVRYSSDVRERMIYGHTTRDVKVHVDHVLAASRRGSVAYQHSLLQTYPPVETQTWLMDTNSPVGKTRYGVRQMRVYVGHEEMKWPMFWYFRDLQLMTYETPQQAFDQRVPFLFLSIDQAAQVAGLEEYYTLTRARHRMHWTPLPPNEKALFGFWRFGLPGYTRLPGTPDGDALEATKAEWYGLWRYWWHRDVMQNPTPKYSVVEYIFAELKPNSATSREQVSVREEQEREAMDSRDQETELPDWLREEMSRDQDVEQESTPLSEEDIIRRDGDTIRR